MVWASYTHLFHPLIFSKNKAEKPGFEFLEISVLGFPVNVNCPLPTPCIALASLKLRDLHLRTSLFKTVQRNLHFYPRQSSGDDLLSLKLWGNIRASGNQDLKYQAIGSRPCGTMKQLRWAVDLPCSFWDILDRPPYREEIQAEKPPRKRFPGEQDGLTSLVQVSGDKAINSYFLILHMLKVGQPGLHSSRIVRAT